MTMIPIFPALLLAAAPAARAQESKPNNTVPAAPVMAAKPMPAENPAELEKKYQEKLKHDFFKKGPWLLDYDEARAEAKKTGKPLFVYFTRSYAY
jgi:hypothetical protein